MSINANMHRFTQPFREYCAGLLATRTIQRMAALPVALVAVFFALSAVFGLLDALTGWRMSVPAWAHVIGALSFAISLTLIAHRHVQRMRAAGRAYLGRGA